MPRGGWSDFAGSKMENTVKNRKQPRKSGLELLRIVAVVLIVAHHLVCHSGYPLFDEPLSVRRLFYQMCFMPFGKVGITLFLLISLWFLVDREQTVKGACRRIWLLERELLFWGFVGLAVQYFDAPESVTADSWLDALFPISRDVWWYATSYAILLLLLPFLLDGLRGIGKSNHGKCCIAMIGLWGIMNLVPGAYLDMYINVIGFVYVAVLLTYYKWYVKPISTRCAVWMVVIGTAVIVGWNVLISVIWKVCHADPGQITIYINPAQKEWSLPILSVSFGLFTIFSRMTFSSRFINRCAKSAFAVYLITEQHYIRDEMLWHRIVLGNFYHSRYSLLIALAAVIVIVVVTTMLDFVRQFLFWCTIDRHKGRLFERVWHHARNVYELFVSKCTNFVVPVDGE